MAVFDAGQTFDEGDTFDADLGAVITGINPIEGDAPGGTQVMITGGGLDKATNVTFAGEGGWWGTAPIVTQSATQLVVTAPPSMTTVGLVNGPAQVIVWFGSTDLVAGTFTYTGAPAPPPPPPGPPVVVVVPDIVERRAWLILGDKRLDLNDRSQGYVCTELNLSYPTVREVAENNPDRHGTDDRTSLMGARAVSATVACIMPQSPLHRDTVARLFGPFTIPGVRPELHYLLDDPARPDDERMVTLRASDWSAPLNGETVRSINLGWVAPDPIIYSATEKTATAWPAGVRTGGLVFPTDQDTPNGPSGVRTYPTDGMPFRFASAIGAGASVQLETDGDTDVFPMLRIYGRITGPAVSITNFYNDGTPTVTGVVGFRPSYTIDVGPRWVDIDTDRRTVTADNGAHLESQVATWGQSWPVIAPNAQNILTLTGSSPDGIAQVIAAWRDGWMEP